MRERSRKRSSLGKCQECNEHKVPAYFGTGICPDCRAQTVIEEARKKAHESINR